MCVYDDKMAFVSCVEQKLKPAVCLHKRFQRKTSDMLKCDTQDVLLTLMHEISNVLFSAFPSLAVGS